MAWLSVTPDEELAFIPDVSRLVHLARSLYESTIEILLRCVSHEDLSFWTDFLDQTPTDIVLCTYGLQALCLVDKVEFRNWIARLVHQAANDPYSVRNLIGLRAMEIGGVWSSDGVLVSAITEAIEFLKRPERDKIILLVLNVSERFGAYFEGSFSARVRQDQAYAAALEIADALFPHI